MEFTGINGRAFEVGAMYVTKPMEAHLLRFVKERGERVEDLFLSIVCIGASHRCEVNNWIIQQLLGTRR